MRIHYLSASALPSDRANGVHVMKMCNAFARRHDVTLFAYRRGPDASLRAYYGVEGTFRIRPLPRLRVPGLTRLSRTLAAALRTRREAPPDLLYGRDLYSLAAAAGAGIPIVFEAHMPPQSRTQRELIGRLFAAPHFARLVVISEVLKGRFAELFPTLPTERILVAHDAADAPPQAAVDPPVDWPARTGTLQVGYAGSLLPGKGAGLVVELARRLPHVDFHLFGGDADATRRLREQDAHGNLFAHGQIEHRHVAACLQRLHVGLLPARRRVVISSGADIGAWMSPLKLFEYMACGLAIVSSDLPVIREVLVDEENALLAPPGDVERWCDAILRLDRNAALRARLAARAREQFYAHYTWTERSGRVLAGLDVGATGAT